VEFVSVVLASSPVLCVEIEFVLVIAVEVMPVKATAEFNWTGSGAILIR
jgi:hypothetical protein